MLWRPAVGRRATGVAFAVAVLTAGCSSESESQPEPGSYVSESVSNEGDGTLFDGDEIALKFGTQDDRLFMAWTAECNFMEVPVHSRDGRLVASPDELRSTLKACDEQRSAQDAWLEDFFTSEPLWERDGDELHLRSTDGSQAITFEKAARDPFSG